MLEVISQLPAHQALAAVFGMAIGATFAVAPLVWLVCGLAVLCGLGRGANTDVGGAR